VYFQTNKDVIERRSFPLLMNIAAVINAHPEIGNVRVEGHTDSRGRADKNRDLSRRRAEAVVRYLVEQGSVPATRLSAEGFGPDRPIVSDARSAADHARNRRVEFNLGNASSESGESDAGRAE
jgi:outer membrane protein OmpA-like peptidoglycan-associated protein